MRRVPSQPRTCSPGRSRSARPIPQQTAWSQVPVPLDVCHSNATHSKEVLSFMFEKRSQPGAPLRNRTVDLLLTMYRSAVLQSQVDRLTCENTSTHWHSRAPDELTPAPFATQSATHFDLALSNSPPSKQALRNPIRLKRTRPSPTLTVAVPGYRFNSFMSQPPGHSDQVTRQSAHRAVTRRVAAHSPKTP
jgi:hypothetical protein